MRIVADYGGTNARLAALDAAGEPLAARAYRAADYPGPAEVVERFVADEGAVTRPRELAIAIAGPARGETLALTNADWTFRRSELTTQLGLDRLVVLNDFEALAGAIPRLAKDDLEPVKPGEAVADAPIGVIGPGTGLGVAALVPAAGRYVVVPGEGGHRDLAATTDEEWRVVRDLIARHGHASAERVLSGPGLENLWRAVGDSAEPPPAATIAAEARRGEARARRATDLFSSFLGAVAGDLALTLGALGGVVLAGGVLDGLGEAFDRKAFAERFVAKGRHRAYLEPVPVRRIVRPHAALLGCAAALAR